MSSSVSSRSRSGLSSRGAHLTAASGAARARQLAVGAVARVLAINAASASADVDAQAHHERDDARLYLPPRQSQRKEGDADQAPTPSSETTSATPLPAISTQQGLSAYARATHGPRKGLDFTA